MGMEDAFNKEQPSPEQPSGETQESKMYEEMDELELTQTEWKVMDLFRKTPDLENLDSLEEIRAEILRLVTEEYAEFGQGDLTEMISNDAGYKFEEALTQERKNRNG